jgi:hypothetical protein
VHREARRTLRRHLPTAVVVSGDFDVFTIEVSISALVFNADIRELDVLINDGEVVRSGPGVNLVTGSIGPARRATVSAIVGLEEALVVALQLKRLLAWQVF